MNIQIILIEVHIANREGGGIEDIYNVIGGQIAFVVDPRTVWMSMVNKS